MYRVLFVAKVKDLTPEYEKYSDDLYSSAKELDGFIGIDSEVIDGSQSVVWDEAENRLHVQKALMEFLLLGRQNL